MLHNQSPGAVYSSPGLQRVFKKHLFWRCLIVTVLLTGLSACGRGCRGFDVNRRPNLVLITIDTLRADHLGCYGYKVARTPNIDGFAASAVLFERAFTVSNNTLPSHAAMLVGKYPHNFGIPRNGFRLPAGCETLATILKSRGYETAAFISASALNSKLGLDRGFDLYNEDFDTREIDQVQRRASATGKETVAWLKGRRKGPFFLWVHYFDPHYPYTPPKPYDTEFYPEYDGPADGSIEFIHGIDGSKGFSKIKTTADDYRKLIALYDGEIAYLDAQLGELFSILNQAQHRERTMVVFVADHGESLTEHKYYFDHGEYLYQPSMHVPLIIRPPSRDVSVAAYRESGPVETIDIFATALGQLGIAVPNDSDSDDLSARWRSASASGAALCFGESCRPWGVEEQYRGRWANFGKAQFVLDYPWKLILTPYKKLVELYRLDTDPGELVNIAHSHPDVVDRLSHELRMWRQSGKDVAAEIDLDNMEKLRSLGYIK